MKNEITLKRCGYYVTGVSDLTMWGGENACIEMKGFKVDHLREIREKINDNGFGVQSINGAICDIFDLYEKGVKEYQRTIFVGTVSENTADFYYEHY